MTVSMKFLRNSRETERGAKLVLTRVPVRAAPFAPWLPPAMLCLINAWAQDAFGIHIYEYEPLTCREYSLEAHLNSDPQGSGSRDDNLLPMRNQTHLTIEPTFRLSDNFALGFMELNAWAPGNPPQFAGWRVLSHIHTPESWELPFRLGFVAEFSFQKTHYEENSRRVELRPILDREFMNWQMGVQSRLRVRPARPGTERGWNFDPALVLGWKRPVFSPSLEYYGEIESLNVPPRGQPEVHQLFIGGDWRVSAISSINLGLGFDLGARGPGIIVKTRFEWDWHRPGAAKP
jgi:hypothetical protein